MADGSDPDPLGAAVHWIRTSTDPRVRQAAMETIVDVMADIQEGLTGFLADLGDPVAQPFAELADAIAETALRVDGFLFRWRGSSCPPEHTAALREDMLDVNDSMSRFSAASARCHG